MEGKAGNVFGRTPIPRLARLAPENAWREHAEEVARKVANGELVIDPKDGNQLEEVFHTFVSRYRTS